MGYMQHHAIVVTSFAKDYADQAHAEAVRIGMAVTPIIDSAINAYYSFMVGPDGSKLGWGADAVGNQQRDEFVAFIRSLAYSDGSSPIDWCEVLYGDDESQCYVVRSGDGDYAALRAVGEDV